MCSSYCPGPGRHLNLPPWLCCPSLLSNVASLICVETEASIVYVQLYSNSNQIQWETMAPIASVDLYKWLFLMPRQRAEPPPSAHYPH